MKKKSYDVLLFLLCAGSALLIGAAGVASRNITYLLLGAFFVVLSWHTRPRKG